MINVDELKNEAKKDLYLDENSIISASSKNGIITCKWLDYYRLTALELNKSKASRDRVELTLYLYYSGKANAEQLKYLGKSKPFGLKIDTKSDIERFIKASKEYIEADDLVKINEQNLKFIDETIQALKFQSTRISNIIAYKKFTEGYNG